ncbi:ABC transporter ATP-binding protein [Nocardia acidivorans]|uniref:ABC transporter ATP-binding protein n=1 Tax=Nocardia acidivorans TaxID=404580 RepID=UPI00082D54F2|nr:ABC transporter ATP-binding protein [Nocardia acidivorans]
MSPPGDRGTAQRYEGAPALQADSLYRFFPAGDDEILALQGVSLTVAAGELVAVVGPSGSGKSTLLSCLAGVDEPDGGTARVCGRRLSRQPEPIRSRLRARYIGMLFQSGNLLPQLTLFKNIVLARRLHPGSVSPPVADLLESVQLGSRGVAYPGELSGGELARAGLAVALANDPAVVLADEPTGELDAGTEAVVLALLRHRADCGGAILVASHSPAVAAAADRIVRLHDGQVLP